jgi:Restriction endonuclease
MISRRTTRGRGDAQRSDAFNLTSPDTPKWKIVENVVTAIERSLNTIEGAKVIANASIRERVSGVARQVDAYVEIPTGPRILRVGVEVRDESVAVDLPEIEQLITKLKKLDIDYGCVVSRAGFTTTAQAEADRNGIETRTIAEVENPDWWLPTSIMLNHRQVELVHFQINFRTEELPQVSPLLGGASATDLQLVLESGEIVPFHDVVAAQGTREVDRPEMSGLKDQDEFTLTIDFRQLTGASLKSPLGDLPMPQDVYALYRFQERTESVKLAAYEGPGGVNAFTGISSSLKKQLTFVTKLNPDGARTISFVANDPKPPKTIIPCRAKAAEAEPKPDTE